MALNKHGTKLYIVDKFNNCVYVFDTKSERIESSIGGYGGEYGGYQNGFEAKFQEPCAIAVHSVAGADILYVLDGKCTIIRRCVKKFDDVSQNKKWYTSTIVGRSERYGSTIGCPGCDARLGRNLGVGRDTDGSLAVTSDGQTLYIADPGNHRIVAVDLPGNNVRTYFRLLKSKTSFNRTPFCPR